MALSCTLPNLLGQSSVAIDLLARQDMSDSIIYVILTLF